MSEYEHDQTAIWALTTLAAPKWKIRLARLFGKKVHCLDAGYVIRGYRWLGKTYFTDFWEARDD